MSMYDMFAADEHLEAEGVWVDYGDFRVLLARAGGANKKYTKYMETKSKPFRRAIQAGAMPEKRSRELLFDVYATTVIKDWEVNSGEAEDGSTVWERGIHMPDGSVGEYSKDNVMLTFRKLPDLFFDLQKQADGIAIFRKEEMEEDAKN
ncbi:MAG: hypothetical protein Tp138OMZ00d2C19078261_69 [Prokaryotic dsDNA virus sp.]|jgi:Zn-finger nucleic acid-binding protein|nr:MAG: hypothetical protein Tp138OMZ00d2C19078261_69 [Prokaryotic dsDNA virus sp.]|tara:strand:- start:17566 stop:18012 length:447 start_codon:yes stop_codon:yes gene_type:complete